MTFSLICVCSEKKAKTERWLQQNVGRTKSVKILYEEKLVYWD